MGKVAFSPLVLIPFQFPYKVSYFNNAGAGLIIVIVRPQCMHVLVMSHYIVYLYIMFLMIATLILSVCVSLW